ncbi:hypothetical protein CC78DRAFT_576273 [Lojkania enalia]|uniref:Uncharacterized protein n=1 Tax=Lojkania enalia TaxID=147567 RepID=A0A9P4KGQ5_9PLEO|nr:hypothetical protein CC78DRAFT_576273 [Didymosphaeria enalia]
MKTSFVALLGFAAYAGNFGADARALSNALEVPPLLSGRGAEVYAADKTKREPPAPVPVKPPVERLIGKHCTLLGNVQMPIVDEIRQQIRKHIRDPSGKYLICSGPWDKLGKRYIKKADVWINKQHIRNNDATKGHKKLDQSGKDHLFPE